MKRALTYLPTDLLWSATTATFSSKGHMTLLISRFESTENPKEKELMGAKSIIWFLTCV